MGEFGLSYESGKQADGTRVVPSEVSALVPPGKNFGFDTIWDVTRLRFVECMQREEIQTNMPFHISTGSISNLSREGLAYFSCCQINAAKRLGKHFKSQAFILNIDGTNEGGKYTHYRCIDNLTGIVVFARKIRSENAEDIASILRKVISLYGKPHAVVSDMSGPTRKAVVEVFGENFPHMICQFHFLRDVGKDILMEAHMKLRTYITKYTITCKLNKYKSKLSKLASEASGKLQEDYQRIYELVLWVLDYKNELTGKGVPFDLAWMHYYERCRTACDMIDKVEKKYIRRRETRKGRKQPPAPKVDKFWVQLAYIRRSLNLLLKNRLATASFNEVKRRDELFSELRGAFHSPVLKVDCSQKRSSPLSENSNGDINAVASSDVKKNLEKIKDRIINSKEPTDAETVILTHIDKYFDSLTTKLFIDGEEVPLPRTNNMCELYFRETKRAIRMIHGQKNLSKAMDQLPAEMAYMRNLESPLYMRIVFDDQPIHNAFAEIEQKQFQLELSGMKEAMPENLVGKPIRNSMFIEDLTSYLKAS